MVLSATNPEGSKHDVSNCKLNCDNEDRSWSGNTTFFFRFTENNVAGFACALYVHRKVKFFFVSQRKYGKKNAGIKLVIIIGRTALTISLIRSIGTKPGKTHKETNPQ